MKLDTTKCLQWAKERGLLGEKPDTSKQFQKLASECMEFLDEINKGNLEKAYLEFGDVIVTMIIYCEQRGLEFERVAEFTCDYGINLGLEIISDLGIMASNEGRLKFSTLTATSSLCRVFAWCKILAPQFDPQKALDLAVEKISNRKTTVVNGTVVKEGDLSSEDKAAAERKQFGNMS